MAVPEVLQHPAAIFEGLKRETDESQKGKGLGLRCYCGIPRTAYRQNGEPCDPWLGQVLMVFVDTNKVVYNWYWYASDPEDPNLPEDHAVRFQERLL